MNTFCWFLAGVALIWLSVYFMVTLSNVTLGLVILGLGLLCCTYMAYVGLHEDMNIAGKDGEE